MPNLRPFPTALTLTFLIAAQSFAQIANLPKPAAHLHQEIDEFSTVAIQGSVHPLAAAFAAQSSPVDDSLPMEHMILRLKGDSNQEALLTQLIAQQHDPKSAFYHKFLTPQDFGTYFGAAPADIAKVTGWLQNHGFTVEEVPAGNRAIIFSGTAGLVTDTFKTQIRNITVNGSRYVANTTDPQIPAALADVVGGIVKLHNFKHGHSITPLVPVNRAQVASHQVSSQVTNLWGNAFMAPSDFSTIYNVTPLYHSGVTGSGQSIAIIARSNIALSDVQKFRAEYSLPPNDPQFILNGTDPGVLQGDSVETILDTEWSGAIAYNATIKVIITASSSSADGVDLSSIYAVNNNVAPIISLSYGACEAGLGSTEVAHYNSLWQQAAAQGQTVLVSSGDSGAAGCQGGSSSKGTGAAINGLCSSPYSTCVGGTEFADTTNPNQYWDNSGNAISYIPETVWNESASVKNGSGLWAGGGGASILFPKPSWQAGIGVPNDGKRDVPDVSLSASGHDGYMVYQKGDFSVGGTSASAPAFAGVMALVNQQTGARQGLINTVLYPLATLQNAGGASVFHDVTSGSNTVPGVTGFTAGVGYDLGSGLGSVNAAVLAQHWTDGIPTFTLSASSPNLSINAGQSATSTITSVASSSFTSGVALTVSGAPTGITASFSPSTISNGSGTSSLTIATAATTAAGTYKLVITGAAGSITNTLSINVTISTALTMAASQSSVTLTSGNSAKVTFTTTVPSGFNSALAMTISGAPAGVTAAFASAAIAAPGSGTATLNLSAASTTASTPGTFPLVITATGGGKTVTSNLSLVVPGFTLSAPSSVSGNAGSTATVAVSTTSQFGFSSPIALSVAGLPTGVTGIFSPATVTGTATSTLSLAIASSAVTGTYPLTITATGGGIIQTASVNLLLGVTGSCKLSAAIPYGGSALYINAGQTASLNVSCSPVQGNLSGTLQTNFGGAPTGVNPQLSTPLTAGGTSSLSISVPSTTAPSTFTLYVAANSTAANFSGVVAIPVVIQSSSFTITPAQYTTKLSPGASAPITILTKHLSSSFNSAIRVTLSMPAGFSASATSSTIAAPGDGAFEPTITAASTVAAGSYTMNVTGTAGSVTQTVPVALVVGGPQSCTLGVNYPSSFAILPLTAGQTGMAQIYCNAASGTFTAPITLSSTGAPTGATVQLPSSMPPGGYSNISIAAASTLAAGNYSINVTATSGTFTRTIPVNFEVSVPASFALATSVNSLSLNTGASGQVTATTTLSGNFKSAVALAWSGLPTGVTASLSNASIASPGNGASTTTFAVSSTAPTGTFTSTLTATGGGITKTSQFTFVIAAPASFTLATSVKGLELGNGSTGQVTATTALVGNFKSAVALSWSGLPTGVTAALSGASIASPGNGTSTTTFTVSASAASGTFTPTLTATGGGITQTAPFTLVITAAGSCTLSAQTQSAATSISMNTGTIVSGQVGCTNVTGAFAKPLSVTVGTVPTGVTVGISSTMTPGSGNTFQISAAATMATTNFNLTFTVASGSFTKSISMPVTITAADFTFTGDKSSVSLSLGGTATQTVRIAHSGSFNQAIYFNTSGLPDGLAVSYSQFMIGAPGDGTSTLTFSASSNVKPGTYNATVMASAVGVSHTVPLTLVVGTSGFTINGSASTVKVNAGSTAQVTATVAHFGSFSSPVTLAWSNLPTGATTALSTTTLAAPGDGTSVTTFTVPSSTSSGNYTPTLTATGGGKTVTVTINLVVSGTVSTPSCSLQAADTSLSGTAGLGINTTITCSLIQGPLSAVTLTTSGPNGIIVQTDTTSLVPGGLAHLVVYAPAGTAASTFNVTVTGKSGSFSKTLTIPVTLNAAGFLFTGPDTVNAKTGSSTTTATFTVKHQGSFSSAIALSWAMLPTGVTATLSPSTLSAPGDGTVVAKFTVAANAPTGGFVAALAGTGGGQSQITSLGIIISK